MSTCLTKLPHSCGSSDGLQVFEDNDNKITGYCFVCHTYVPDPLGEGGKVSDIPKSKRVKKTEREILDEIASVGELKAVDLVDRRLRAKTLDHYGIKVGFSEEDGKTPKFVHFPYTKNGRIVRYKTRLLTEKKMWSFGIEKEVDLFGWEQAKTSGVKRLIITEGEFDAVALTRILEICTKPEYKDYTPAVISITNGASGAAKEISKNLKEIRDHFNDISLCFDNDEAGKKAVEEVCKICPDFKVITLPLKDANECLMQGRVQAAYKAVTFNAKSNKNSKLVWGEDIHIEAKKPAQWGFSWPWEHVNRATKGIRLGETIYIGAGQKQGKSELVNALAAHFIKEHDWSVLLAKPEEANNKTYKMVAGKLVGKRFHDPEVPFDEEAYEKAGQMMRGKLAMLNIYQHLGFETLKADIRTAAIAGVKAVFIDPITNLVNGIPTSEQNTKLQEIAQELSAMALDLEIVIFIFCHLRNPDNGPPHERGGEVLSSQFAGSRAMARSCNLMFGLEGNRDPNLTEGERNIKTLVLLEDREFGNTGRFKLYWDKTTTLFNEYHE